MASWWRFAMARCLQCNGAGEIEHPAYRELDRLWLKGFIFDEEGITDFWLNRGCNPANPPQRYSLCADCGGTGDMAIHENPILEARALAAWREAHPQGLIGRLIDLHRRDPQKALVLARYAEPHGYEGLAGDVAAWPVVRGPSRLRVFYRGMDPDQTLCPVCGGWGRVEPRDVGESLADGLEKYPELGVEGVFEEIPCPSCGGWGEVPIEKSPCPSCSGSGRWGDDIPCGRCNGEGVAR
jgi:hypothetical protein